jgi:hypothetical protein
MLFTDGNPADSQVLQGYEAAILDVASTQGIDLAVKLELAGEQLGDEIESRIRLRGNGWPGSAPTLDCVVVTSGLRRWHAMQSLELIYRDAYYQDLNDRYKAKWQMYKTLRTEARDMCFAAGIGFVGSPVSKGPKLGSSMSMGTGPNGFLFARATWVNESGIEGAGGPLLSIEVPTGSVATVSIVEKPEAGFRWNIYAGRSEDDLHLQNRTALDPSTLWVADGPLGENGPVVSSGQPADYWVVENRRIPRG